MVELFDMFQEISTSTISPAAIQTNALDKTVTAVVELIETSVATASACTTSPAIISLVRAIVQEEDGNV